MLAMHRYLRLTNSKVLVASLADAAGEKRAQNQPGTMNEYPNWRVPLMANPEAMVVVPLRRPIEVTAIRRFTGSGVLILRASCSRCR